MAEQNRASNNARSNLPVDISWIQKILDKYFSQMPAPVRIFTYLCILFLFTYAFLAAITMEVVFEGKINRILPKEARSSGGAYGRLDYYNVIIELGKNNQYSTIATDRQSFYVTLPFIKLLEAKTSGYFGRVHIKIKNGEQVSNPDDPEYQPQFVFKSLPFTNKFNDINIEYDFKKDNLDNNKIILIPREKQSVYKAQHNNNFSIINSALAGNSKLVQNKTFDSANEYRIYVDKITIPKSFENHSVSLSVVVNESKFFPLTSRYTRSPNYSISVSPESEQYFYGGYYFTIPKEGLNKLKFVAEYPSKLPFIKNKTYTKLDDLEQLKYGTPIEVVFDNQVEMKLRLATAYELVFFRLDNSEIGVSNLLWENALKDGLYLFDIPSIRGKKSNAIFASKSTPINIVKQVIANTVSSGLVLNTIQCTSSLKTTAKNQIQIGYSSKYTTPKSKEKIDKLLQITDELEFRKLCDAP